MTQAGDRLNRNLVLANIPAFPPIVLRVLGLLSVEPPDTTRLVEEISADPTLSPPRRFSAFLAWSSSPQRATSGLTAGPGFACKR